MPKSVLFSTILITIICVTNIILYQYHLKKKVNLRTALVNKYLASFSFVLLALFNLKLNITVYNILIFVGLILGLIGDMVLALRYKFTDQKMKYFVSGAIIFFLGHLVYIHAMIVKNSFELSSFLISLVLLSLITYFYQHHFKYNLGKIKILMIIYLFTLNVVSSLAFSNLVVTGGIGSLILFIGTLLFIFSDNLLVVYNFIKKDNQVYSNLVHFSYYLAQVLIAISIFYL